MANVVVVGAQWGDEGKGKITDLLAEQATLVVRYQGGANAGHTVIANGVTYKLHLVPSGILYPKARCVIGSGTVIDPAKLLEEIALLKGHGLDLTRLHIALGAHVTMPYHRILDKAEEARRGASAIGTTGLGIGPTYTDKANRSGFRLGDLLEPEGFKKRLAEVLELKNLILTRIYGLEPLSLDAIYEEYRGFGEQLRPYLTNASVLVDETIKRGENVLFEGAQGTLLDIDQGTYPYVTSSHPIAGGACVGVGIGPTAIDRVLGVAKAYTTRVGAGPFPTELTDALGEGLRERGQEFGTTTGRARRCGWFDAVVARLAVRVNGLDGLAITKLDVLDGMEALKICTAYRYRGETLTEFPTDYDVLSACEPVYESMPGWRESTGDVRTLEALPQNARKYLARLSELLGVKISLVAVGPSREQTIVVEDPLTGPRRKLVS
ncbi:MAG TPA: adenylosuccinate synthase [Oscillatoriaceae cyanobacterium]